MQGSHRFRFYGAPLFNPIAQFFCFIGHLCDSGKEILVGRVAISWSHQLDTIYRSGVKLVIPLILISSLTGISIVLNIFYILSPYNMQHDVLLVAQHILFYDLLPFLIAFMLTMQASLNLVSAGIKKLQQTPQEVVLMHIIPIMLATNFSAFLLYIYSLNTVLISIYFCFRYLLRTDIHEYLFHLTNTISGTAIIFSILKTALYCTIVSLIVGYYYYEVASGYLSLRKAMSRIMTRSFIWLAVGSVYFKFFDY